MRFINLKNFMPFIAARAVLVNTEANIRQMLKECDVSIAHFLGTLQRNGCTNATNVLTSRFHNKVLVQIDPEFVVSVAKRMYGIKIVVNSAFIKIRRPFFERN